MSNPSEKGITSSDTLDSDDNEELLADAESAQGSVGVLVEILSGCTPGQQVTGVFMRSLLVDVKMHLDNVVDGLRVVSQNGVPL